MNSRGAMSSHILTIQQPLLYITWVIGDSITSAETVQDRKFKTTEYAVISSLYLNRWQGRAALVAFLL